MRRALPAFGVSVFRMRPVVPVLAQLEDQIGGALPVQWV